MWSYKAVSREDFEKRKDLVEQIMRELGCEVAEFALPNARKTTSIVAAREETWFSQRPLYKFRNGFYRIDEVLFPEKPFIVLEFAETEDSVKMNAMEDLDPFPYDLSDDDMINEVKYSLGIEPYP
ncbi:MAG: hypothetical protein K2J80_13195 [Oscillospiraceae bacterium]|nr:hypothetical protein [Oscillospiraceae bacterium]